MNPFTQHTRKQGVTYLEHAIFALSIARRLFSSVTAFAMHAIFPFIDIERHLDLEATSDFLQERNDWIESQKFSTPQSKAWVEDRQLVQLAE